MAEDFEEENNGLPENIENYSDFEENPQEKVLETEEIQDDTVGNLKDEIEVEEEELLPPEEQNEAKQLNIGNVLAVTFLVIAVIVLIIFLASSGKKEKKTEKEFDTPGYRSEYNFKYPDQPNIVVVQDGYTLDPYGNISSDQSELKQIMNAETTLPPEYQLPQTRNTQQYNNQYNQNRGTAPAGVNSVGSGGSSSDEKPDTKNSQSVRKIEGIYGLSNSGNSNTDRISSVMSGNYQGYQGYQQNPYGSQNQTKEQYIAENLTRMQQQNPVPGSSKESFFNNNSGNIGQGSFLPDNCLWDGTIISGALITAINTDNPGTVMAKVTENVYSSLDHRYLLIPEGSTLFGQYNYDVSYGQASVQVAWNLLIRPDGYRITLGNFAGVNQQGASGYDGSVSNHPFQTLKALGMVTLFSIIETEVSNDIASQNNQYLQNALTDVYKEASRIENRILDRALDIKPTIKIKEGTEIKLITNAPLELPPYQVPEVKEKYIRVN